MKRTLSRELQPQTRITNLPPPLNSDFTTPADKTNNHRRNLIRQKNNEESKDEKSPSPSKQSISEWFDHPLTPPEEQHAPSLFDGTAHLVERQNQRRAAFCSQYGKQQAPNDLRDPLLLSETAIPFPTSQTATGIPSSQRPAVIPLAQTPQVGQLLARTNRSQTTSQSMRTATGVPSSQTPTVIPSSQAALGDSSSPPGDRLSDQSNRAQTTSQSTTTTVPSQENIPINIEFLFYITSETQPATNPCKRRQGAIPTPRAKKIESEPDKLVLQWDPANTDLDSLKEAVLNCLKTQEDRSLGIFAQNQDQEGNIYWYVVIPHGGSFAATHKRRLDSQSIFAEFVQVAMETPESRKIVCCLVQKDPKVLAQRASAYSQLNKIHASTSLQGPSAPSIEPSDGAQAAATNADLVQQIYAMNEPCKRLTGSHEKQRKNPGLVTLTQPPKSDVFVFKTQSKEVESSSSSLSHPNVQQIPPNPSFPFPMANWPFMNSMPNMFNLPIPTTPSNTPNYMTSAMCATQQWSPQPVPAPIQASTSTAPPEMPSTPPMDSSIDKFLNFAHVDLDAPQLCEAMKKLGITHWSMFRYFTSEELVNAGLAPGPA
ncbi:hypothetical protein PCASD_09010 [Puccinia coronata f. sp. avenae]|uniref:Uncharacterized protein n=1 Tax=Puccinia coronata f. sp. avenae TaxID=200324 RepID=A0A2N5UKJ6_9BASI|nr:hypothetical protein PCASD_09010 [Puccinia coronata f. sp. avenae]